IPITLIETDYALPGRGRNIAIAQANNEWIACLDAGVVPQSDWLAELVATAQRAPTAQIIYGNYEPIRDTYFTECAAITYVPPTRNRSIASCLIRRDVWAVIGGFREDLRASEDLLFFRKLDQANVKDAYSERACVKWQLQPTLGRTFRRFTIYSCNGMKAGLSKDWQFNVTRLYLIILALLIAGILAWPFLVLPPLLLLLRAEKRILSWFRVKAPERLWPELINPRRVLMVAWINIAIDIATFYGMCQWFVQNRSKQVKELSSRADGSLD
ncbi:MAG TPA: glycosyltransferase, partial [Pyrinomonadaceae bacterium]|nr:glycosyltransferase [Pyrinomonadaceae bacterium]